MPDPHGFLRYGRRLPPRRPVPVRLLDWREVYPSAEDALVREQATRCMDCGVPFCHGGCPLGNRIPDWNDLVRTGAWEAAGESLHATNNFPELTGRLCPAPCEAACVLGIGGADEPVAIKLVEAEIADRALASGALTPRPAATATGRRVAIVGSGPTGLAAAQQLARAGHEVTVYERDDAPGGLLRYGIPDFKLEKRHVDARLTQLAAEGVRFVTGCAVGIDVPARSLREEYDAVLLACGALASRDMDAPGRALRGVHLALGHLVGANRHVAGLAERAPIDAAGRHVVIIGGGDTAADCLGVAHRQGAASVTSLDIYPVPPSTRDDESDPWPTWPWLLRNYPAHEEGGERVFGVAVREFVDDGTGAVRAVRLVDVRGERGGGRRSLREVPGSQRELAADLVLLAIGFAGTGETALLDELAVEHTDGVVACDADWQTSAPGVFVAGDMHRGASLIVWAIAEGRAAASAIHAHLGGAGSLPTPVTPAARALVAR